MSATPAAASAADWRIRARSWWQQLSAVMIKEAKQVTRDPSSWIIAVVLPLTFLFLFGYGISLDTTVVKVAVVREDDGRDAQDLAAMLRLGRLAEAWIAPPATRELRELVRYRFSLVGHRTSAKAQIHGVMV